MIIPNIIATKFAHYIICLNIAWQVISTTLTVTSIIISNVAIIIITIIVLWQ